MANPCPVSCVLCTPGPCIYSIRLLSSEFLRLFGSIPPPQARSVTDPRMLCVPIFMPIICIYNGPGFASELAYPTKISLPSRGDGPRCEVVWETGDGPWAMVVILCIDTAEDPPTTEYIECLMPKVYAIPLMMVNKQLAFFESLRTETGAVRELPPERSKLKLGKVQLLEYTYLWRLRTEFLQAIYDAEYDAEAGNQDLGPDWRWPPIHGYLVREHRGWGHNLAQREGYWKDARNSNRIPYEDEIIEDLGQS